MDNLHGVIDDAALERMRKEQEVKRAAISASMGRKHLLHPANRVQKEATKPFLSGGVKFVEDPALPNDIVKVVQPNRQPQFFRIK